jgi:hypothetical protein
MTETIAESVEKIKEEFKLTVAQDHARDMLISDAVHCCLGGGSRSGKTFLLVRMIVIRALKAPGSRHAIFRFRFNAIKASIIYDTLPKVFALCFPGLWNPKSLNKTDWFYKFDNGSEIWFGGLDDKERTEKILGQEYVTLYFNETSQIPWASRVLAMSRLAQKVKVSSVQGQPDTYLKLKAYYDLNPSSKNHWVYRVFIEKKDPISKQELNRPFNYAYYKINPIDNLENLSDEYIHELEDLPVKARRRFLNGEFEDDENGQLWTIELLEQNRVLGQKGTLPDFLRVVIAVDPSGCTGAEDSRSDEIGIMVCALGTDNHGYLIEDLSGKYSPETWGQIIVAAYERHSADRVVGEVNYGGDMVRAVVHAVDNTVPFNAVTASRGKVVRAQPISTLYEMNKIHHIGYFPEVEDQMCSMTQSGYQGIGSPDKVDAAVWGFTELFPGMTKKAGVKWTAPAVHTSKRSSSRFENNSRARPTVKRNRRY